MDNTPPPRREKISADVIWGGGGICKGEEKGGEVKNEERVKKQRKRKGEK
jgi:hypothetical protein